MTEELLEYLRAYFNFEISKLLPLDGYFKIEKKKKKEYLLKEGNYSDDIYLIINGYIRTYHLSEKGDEITTEIYRKGEMVSSLYSIMKKTPSDEYIQCINECKLYKISAESFKELRTKDPQWFQLGFNILKTELLKKEDRIRGFTKLKANDRYLKLIAENQDLVKNIPIQYLASYLGMKPESLSRIRSELLNT